MVYRSVNRFISLAGFQANYRSYGRPVTRSIEQSVAFPFDQSFVWSVGRSFGGLVDRSVGRLIGLYQNMLMHIPSVVDRVVVVSEK